MPQGGHAPHQPGRHPTPGPSLPAAAEGVPGEAAEGPQDQPAQVGWVGPRHPLPPAPTLLASVFLGSEGVAGAQEDCGCRLWLTESPSGAVTGEGFEVDVALRHVWTPRPASHSLCWPRDP